jgi:sulfonate transport system permease protein
MQVNADTMWQWFCRRGVSYLSPLLLIVVWQVLAMTHLFPEQILVPPYQVFLTLLDLWREGDLPEAFRASGFRLLFGYGIGSICGIVYGIWVGLFPTAESYTGLVFHALRQVPTIALVPLFILLFGIEETFKIMMIAFAAFFPVALNTIDGIRDVPAQYREVAAVFRFSHASIIRRIILPAVLPSLVTGLRLALSRSWLILVAAEILASTAGIGHLINWGRQLFQIDVVMVGVVVAGVIGFLLDSLLKSAETKLLRWKGAAS